LIRPLDAFLDRLRARAEPPSRIVPRQWVGLRAASDTVTHGTWIIVAVALGALSVGAFAVPGGPVHHWLTCHIRSISDIQGQTPPLSACGSPLAAKQTDIALLGNSALTFSASWSGIWSELIDTSNTPEFYALGNSVGLYEPSTSTVIGGAAGPQALLTYETPSITYQTFTFSGYSYNGSLTTALPVINALVENNGTVTPKALTWVGPPSTPGLTQSSESQTLSLPPNTVGIAWGLDEESGQYDAGNWVFTLQNPVLIN